MTTSMNPVNTFCTKCILANKRVVVGGRFCGECGSPLSPLPAHVVASLTDLARNGASHGTAVIPSAAVPASQLLRAKVREAPSGKITPMPRLELVVPLAHGGERLLAISAPFALLLGAVGEERHLEVTVGRGKNMPVYFHANAMFEHKKVKLSDELNRLGYGVGDEPNIEAFENGHRFAIRPSGRPPEQVPLISPPDPLECPKLKRPRPFQWSLPDVKELVREYDNGSWRDHSNVELDREAYALFEGGLDVDEQRLIAMLSHVGMFYGGAYRPDGDCRHLAQLIATDFRGQTAELQKLLNQQRPLTEQVPSVRDVAALLRPFQRDKTWFVWGAKFLHFLRPDAFPIIDRRVEAALGYQQRLSNSPGYLVSFCQVTRDVLLTNLKVIQRARATNSGSPSDLKLLDKLLWVIGGRTTR
jgi:hypothetical protein